MDYTETLKFIHSLGNFTLPPTLDRINCVLQKLSSPHKKFNSIHIAGTNGKGSVSAMLSRVFTLNGLKTGLFISPYIINFRERIQIDGNFISENDIVKYSEKVKNTGVPLTEFEFITAVAFLYYADNGCDIVIAETGLGGRLDATNTLDSKIAVITKIGLDHTAILGDTIEKIAAEKCGIIKNAVNVIASPNQEKKALNVILNTAENRLTVPEYNKLSYVKFNDSGTEFIYEDKCYTLSLCGEFQVENALTVIETAKCMGVPYETVKKALGSTFFPARMEVIRKKPLTVLDGAHNPDGAKVLAAELKKYGGSVTAIIGVMRDKNYKEVLKTALPYCKAAVAVTVEGMARSLGKDELKSEADKYCRTVKAENYSQAIEKANAIAQGDPIFIFGSLYLAAGIREKFSN